jgi:hypothetical protein
MRKALLLLVLSFLFLSKPAYSAYRSIEGLKILQRVDELGPSRMGETKTNSGYIYFDNFTDAGIRYSEWGIFCKNLKDTLGLCDRVGIYCTADRRDEAFVRMDSLGYTIYKYRRHPYPSVVVDGNHLERPFPFYESDAVDPDKIPGTADEMVESWIITEMGITIRHRALGWQQANHDDYVIYEYVLKNTGNVDSDDEIELPNQTIEDFYFGRCHAYGFGHAWGGNAYWCGAYGRRPGDSLRIMYAYDANSPGAEYDDLGNPTLDGEIVDPEYMGEAVIHVDSSSSNHSDDPAQPQMTGSDWYGTCSVILTHQGMNVQDRYYKMEQGLNYMFGIPYIEGAYEGTHHTLQVEERGVQYPENIPDFRNWTSFIWSCGPYDIPFGDSIRIVWAQVAGTITPKTAFDIGPKWASGECEWNGPYKLPPSHIEYPELSPTDNDKAKDSWITTGKDSLFKHAWAAQWAARNDYQIPKPPPPPSVEVQSRPDRIVVKWGDEAESAPDLVGYRIYRASGDYYYHKVAGQVVGDWQLIGEVGKGTNVFEDKTAIRGVAYYYYVAAFDDGSHPEVPSEYAGGVSGEAESLENTRFLNMTTQPAYLTRFPGEDLSDIRVVPNPFSVAAERLQFEGEPNKIMFMNLPPYCTIKIYNETGDLIKIIEHTDGSGDETWADPARQQYMTTSSDQVPVSGLYIARIITPDGRSTNVKFAIVR